MREKARALGSLVWLVTMAGACQSETPDPAGLGAPGDGEGGSAGNAGGSAGNAGDVHVPPDLDAGVGVDPNSPTGDASARTERRFCGFDGHELGTYLFPSGERLQTLNVRNQFRSFGRVAGIDSTRGEVFVESCVNSPRLAPTFAFHSSCSLDAFSVTDVGRSAPLRSIRLSPTEAIASVAIDSDNDTLIALVEEPELRQGYSGPRSTRVLTLARNAVDLSTPIRQLDGTGLSFRTLDFDAERGELYVSNGVYPTEILVFARDASGGAAPLRRLTFDGEFLLSATRDEYHRSRETTLETYALPLSVVPDVLPLRTLTGIPASSGERVIDELHGELWRLGRPATVYDLTASGEAAPLRTVPNDFGYVVGALPGRDEMVFQTGYNAGGLSFYARTALDGPPLRVIEAGKSTDTYELLAIDVQRGEVFFLNGTVPFSLPSTSIVMTYALGATGDAAPLRRLNTSLSHGTTLFDPSRRELLGSSGNNLVAYAAGAEGQGVASPRFGLELEADESDFSLGVLDSVHDQLLGVIGASGRGEAASDSPSDYDGYANLAVFSLTGTLSYPRRQISSLRGLNLHYTSPSSTEGRLVSVSDLIYDSRNDEVVLAIHDCFFEEGGPGAAYTEDYSDCHYELRSYPRASGSASRFSSLELPEEIRALDYDAESDMLMVSGQSHVYFLARAEQSSGTVTLPDAGPTEREVTHQFPLAGAFQYCD